MPLFRQQVAIAALGESAAAQRQHRRPAAFDPAHVLPQDIALRCGGIPPRRASSKISAMRGLLGRLDLVVEIEEAPAQAMGQMRGRRWIFPAPMKPTT